MKIQIRELAEGEYASAVTLMQVLEPELSAQVIAERSAGMRSEGWVCIGVFSGSEMLGLAGYSLRTHLFSGRVMFVENVVLVPTARGTGIGEQLMKWLEEKALALSCRMLTLDAYARNLGARTFYQRLAYDPRGVHFVKELSPAQ